MSKIRDNVEAVAAEFLISKGFSNSTTSNMRNKTLVRIMHVTRLTGQTKRRNLL